jgi:hypothetical protein
MSSDSFDISDTLATPRSGLPPNLGPSTRRRGAIQDLRSVVVVTQLSFSLVLATLLALAPPVLLLLNRELSISTHNIFSCSRCSRGWSPAPRGSWT